jgi:hypothetical protein
MLPIPDDLLAALPDRGHPAAEQWWASLSEKQQRQVCDLWSQRVEVRFFEPIQHKDGTKDDWCDVPDVQGGRFIPREPDFRFEASAEYWDFLFQHREHLLAYEPETGRFHHICTQHWAARRCREQGMVPADYACPLGSQECPLEAIRGASLKTAKAS